MDHDEIHRPFGQREPGPRPVDFALQTIEFDAMSATLRGGATKATTDVLAAAMSRLLGSAIASLQPLAALPCDRRRQYLGDAGLHRRFGIRPAAFDVVARAPALLNLGIGTGPHDGRAGRRFCRHLSITASGSSAAARRTNAATATTVNRATRGRCDRKRISMAVR
ncbi:MAG: hypothetical protein ACLP1D_21110 [Xanthobacteraceae bacterium]